jgi:nucleoside-diphosphate-sugar epimerase
VAGIDPLSGTKVLVTGGCGFIGLNLIAELTARGAVVSVLDLPGANWHNVPGGVAQVKADLLDGPSFTGAADDVEVVYHLAARTDIDSTVVEEYAVNFDGTEALIAECVRSGSVRRFVFYSTQLVVGLFNEARFIDESEPYRTKTAYGQSKILGEQAVMRRCREAGIAYTILRPTSVYGPWGETPYREFFRAIKRRRYFHVGRAENLVSWVYVKNLVALTILSSLSPDAENETFFANDFHPYTMREIVEAVAGYYRIAIPTLPSILVTALAYALAIPKRAGINVPLYPFRLANIKASYCYDIRKSVSIGYAPEYDLARGVAETLAWYDARKLI